MIDSSFTNILKQRELLLTPSITKICQQNENMDEIIDGKFKINKNEILKKKKKIQMKNNNKKK